MNQKILWYRIIPYTGSIVSLYLILQTYGSRLIWLRGPRKIPLRAAGWKALSQSGPVLTCEYPPPPLSLQLPPFLCRRCPGRKSKLALIDDYLSENSDYIRWIPNYHDIDRTWRLSCRLFIDHEICVKLHQFLAVCLQSWNKFISWKGMKFDCNYRKRLIFRFRTSWL